MSKKTIRIYDGMVFHRRTVLSSEEDYILEENKFLKS